VCRALVWWVLHTLHSNPAPLNDVSPPADIACRCHHGVWPCTCVPDHGGHAAPLQRQPKEGMEGELIEWMALQKHTCHIWQEEEADAGACICCCSMALFSALQPSCSLYKGSAAATIKVTLPCLQYRPTFSTSCRGWQPEKSAPHTACHPSLQVSRVLYDAQLECIRREAPMQPVHTIEMYPMPQVCSLTYWQALPLGYLDTVPLEGISSQGCCSRGMTCTRA
jgi:hypothetical protein